MLGYLYNTSIHCIEVNNLNNKIVIAGLINCYLLIEDLG